jgi:hypothetical protein
LPEANNEWTQIHLQDFKSIEDYNHVIHMVCAKLHFCEKEPSEEDKIEKTLQNMLPSDRVLQYQYQARNYQHYADLIRDLLQAEKHDELTIKNYHQRRVGAAPLPEIHHNEKKHNFSKDNNLKKNGRSTRRRCNRRKNRQLAKTIKKDGTPSKGHVVVSSILLRNVVHPSTLWLCTRNLKVRDLDMKPTSPSRQTQCLKLVV